jgi:threonylcarbamoyladenosine tRNA methylthiotransferase MtaB
LKDETIDFVSESNVFVPHFHIPLQSGSDELLKKMKRRYLTGLYTERVSRIKEKMPDACIGVDVIVGFPGETEELFQETYSLLNELDISYLHVFTYSERANTEAAVMEDVIDKGIRNQRSKMLRILSAKKKRAFYEKNIGSTRTVLFEHDNKNGFIQGFTENYVKVKLEYDPGLRNQIVKVKLNDFDEDGTILAEILN